jgi:hypothetical protein
VGGWVMPCASIISSVHVPLGLSASWGPTRESVFHRTTDGPKGHKPRPPAELDSKTTQETVPTAVDLEAAPAPSQTKLVIGPKMASPEGRSVGALVFVWVWPVGNLHRSP